MHYGILAGGDGSRLAAEGVNLPKPLVPVDGLPMIKRLIGIFVRCKAESISILVNSKMEDVKTALASLDLRTDGMVSIPVNVIEASTPSSMHSFAVLRKIMPRHGKFVITTVDTIFREKALHNYVEAFIQSDYDSLMGVTDYIDDEKPLYVATTPAAESAYPVITAFSDSPRPDASYISAGIYGLTPKAFEVLDRCIARGESRMRNFQRALLSDGLDVHAFPMGKVLDIDHASDIEKANHFLQDS